MSSENMSTDWGQFYHHHRQTPPVRTIFGVAEDGVPETTMVTTTTIDSGNSSGGGHLSPEGRISKPVRRKSRASRRTPTTLLNTDTTNFRAMVQQFTGGPSVPFGSGESQSLSFDVIPNRQQEQQYNNSGVMVPAGFQIQHPQTQLPFNMFSLGNNTTTATIDPFFHRYGNNNPRPSDGLVMDSVISARAPPPPTSSNENASNSFLF